MGGPPLHPRARGSTSTGGEVVLAQRREGGGGRLFKGGGERFRLRVPVGGLLVDLPVVFASRMFPSPRSDQSLRKQRQNALEDLLAAGLCPQDSARLLHFAAFLSIAVPRPTEQMCFYLLPGRTGAISHQEIG